MEHMAARAGYPPGEDPGRWRAFTVCLMAGFMTLLDVSIVNVALPSMQTGLRVSSSELSWVVAGYTLTFGLALAPAGRLGDSFGRRRMFLIGLALFTLASAGCGLALGGVWIVCGRLAQGLAGGLLSPQIVGLMQQLFSGAERGRASGRYAAMIAAGTAVGPMVGGVIIQVAGVHTGWRWVFFVNLPIGIVAWLLGLRLLPRDAPNGARFRPDLFGVALLGAGIACVILPLTAADQGGHVGDWYLIADGAAFLFIFVWWELRLARRKRQPVVNLGLLRDRSYAFGALIGIPYFAGYSGVPFVVSLYFQQGLKYTALQAGAAAVPFAIGSAVSAPISGRAVGRLGRLLVVAGAVAVVLGLGAAAALVGYTHGAADTRWLILAGPLLLAGLGSGAVVGPNLTLALQKVSRSEGSGAAAMLQTGQRVGSAVGLAVVGSLFFGTLAITHHTDFASAAGKAMAACVALVGAALLVAAADLVTTTRAEAHHAPAHAAATTADALRHDQAPSIRGS